MVGHTVPEETADKRLDPQQILSLAVDCIASRKSGDCKVADAAQADEIARVSEADGIAPAPKADRMAQALGVGRVVLAHEAGRIPHAPELEAVGDGRDDRRQIVVDQKIAENSAAHEPRVATGPRAALGIRSRLARFLPAVVGP